jgi:hypothetical protein
MPLGPPSIEDLIGDPSEGFEYRDMPGWRTVGGGGGGYIAAAGGQGGVRHIQSRVEPQMITTKTWTQEQYDEFQEESRRASEAQPDHSSGQLSVGGQPLIPVPRGGIAVESTGRGVRVIPPGTDLGRYFERQRRSAEAEAARILFWLGVDIALTLAGPGIARAVGRAMGSALGRRVVAAIGRALGPIRRTKYGSLLFHMRGTKLAGYVRWGRGRGPGGLRGNRVVIGTGPRRLHIWPHDWIFRCIVRVFAPFGRQWIYDPEPEVD